MPVGLILSLFISLSLIGGAFWNRLKPSSARVTNDITVVSAARTEEESGFLSTFLNPKEGPSEEIVAPPAPLTNSDILGRGLLSDYVNLAVNNKASDENIEAVANKYIEAVPMLIPSEFASYVDLKTVPNNKENFQKYADEATKIHQDYAQSIKNSYNGADLSTLNPELYAFTEEFAKAYRTAAMNLKDLPVPTTLLSLHLKLINTYLSSSSALEAISKIDNDSAVGFSGLVTWNQNLRTESIILNLISQILTKNGI